MATSSRTCVQCSLNQTFLCKVHLLLCSMPGILSHDWSDTERKVTIPTPAYPRPAGVAPPPSRPVSTQGACPYCTSAHHFSSNAPCFPAHLVKKGEIDPRSRQELHVRRPPHPQPGGESRAPPVLTTALVSSSVMPALSSTSSTQSDAHTGSPPPVPSQLNKPKNTVTQVLSAGDDPLWDQHPRFVFLFLPLLSCLYHKMNKSTVTLAERRRAQQVSHQLLWRREGITGRLWTRAAEC